MRRIPRSAHMCGLLLLFTVAICVALGQAGRITKPATTISLPPTLRAAFNVPYREDTGTRKTTLDIVYHADNAEKRRPAIVFIHGGGWSAGDKHFYRPTLVRWAGKGYVCIGLNYRLAGQGHFPAPIEDVKTAIRWLRAHAGEYGVDPERIAASGVSAGAHLAALAGASQQGDGLDGVGPWQGQSSAVACVIARSGVYDLQPEVLGRNGCKDIAVVALLDGRANEKPALARQASPVAYLDAADPPMLIIHGTTDRRIPYRAAEHLAQALGAAGVEYELLPVDAGGHGDSPSPEREAEVQASVERFLKEHL